MCMCIRVGGSGRGVGTGPASETVTAPGGTPSWRSSVPREATPQAAARLHEGALLHSTRKPNILEANESHPTRHTAAPVPSLGPTPQPAPQGLGWPPCLSTHSHQNTNHCPVPGVHTAHHSAPTLPSPSPHLCPPRPFGGKQKKPTRGTARVAAGDEKGRSPSRMVQFRTENRGRRCASPATGVRGGRKQKRVFVLALGSSRPAQMQKSHWPQAAA